MKVLSALLNCCLLLVGCGSLCFAEVVNQQSLLGSKPNIIFIFADDWGWGDLSCHGNDIFPTPNLDRLAAEGTDFYQFTVNSPVCSPSRTALITGHFPGRYKVDQHFASVEHHQRWNMPDWLDPEAPMLPRMLKKAGYATAHFGKWHLTNRHVNDAPYPTEYGYDEYGAFNLPGPQIKAGESCKKAIEFIHENQDKPFFINLWIHETHTPHYPLEETLKRFAHLDERSQVYASVVADGDARIGEVLDVLEELDLEEDTLVIFSSDNGPEITGKESKIIQDNSTGPGLNHYYSVGDTGGLRGRKRSLYAGGIRTPFLARWPGKIAAGEVNKQTVITAVDMLPTFLELAGAEAPQGYVPDGESILPALLGSDYSRSKPIFWQWHGGHQGDNWPHLGVRQGSWKMLCNAEQGKTELYNLSIDWPEQQEVAQANPAIVEQLTELLIHWEETLPEAPNPTCFSAERKQ